MGSTSTTWTLASLGCYHYFLIPAVRLFSSSTCFCLLLWIYSCLFIGRIPWFKSTCIFILRYFGPLFFCFICFSSLPVDPWMPTILGLLPTRLAVLLPSFYLEWWTLFIGLPMSRLWKLILLSIPVSLNCQTSWQLVPYLTTLVMRVRLLLDGSSTIWNICR